MQFHRNIAEPSNNETAMIILATRPFFESLEKDEFHELLTKLPKEQFNHVAKLFQKTIPSA